MAGLDPSFNDWNFFTNVVCIITQAEFDYSHSTKGQKALIADGGIVPEGTMDTLHIRLNGTITGTSASDVRSKWGTLLKNLRGTDRVKKGRLNLHGDGHYFCQLVGATPVPIIEGDGNARVSLEFEADEPFRRSNSIISYSEIMSVSDPYIIVANPGTFTGDAFRIPFVLKPPTTLAWTKGDVIRVQNLTVGWRFEHVLSQDLAVGKQVTLDGETMEVLEDGVPIGEGNSGGGLYLRGGVTNTIALIGTKTTKLAGAWSVEFFDRFMG
jgi:hypothetical protein